MNDIRGGVEEGLIRLRDLEGPESYMRGKLHSPSVENYRTYVEFE